MHPFLFHLRYGGADHPVAGYGVLILAGMALALTVGARRAPRYGVAPFDLFAIGVLVCVAGVIGAAGLYAIVHFQEVVAAPRAFLAQPGMVFYGGFLLAVPTALLYARAYRVPLGAVADAGAPALPLGHALGRVGCFLGGCCYGRPTRSPLGMVFDPSTPAGQAALAGPIHPVQLYEAVGLALVAALVWLAGRRLGAQPRGTLFLLYLALYALLRLATEQLRGDDVARGLVLGCLSTSQAISLALLATAAALYLILRRRSGERLSSQEVHP